MLSGVEELQEGAVLVCLGPEPRRKTHRDTLTHTLHTSTMIGLNNEPEPRGSNLYISALLFLSRLQQRQRLQRGRTDGQSVPEVSGGLHRRGNIRRWYDISVREHQQVHGAHAGTQTREGTLARARQRRPLLSTARNSKMGKCQMLFFKLQSWIIYA